MEQIGIVTCRELPEVDPDEPLLLEALRGAGFWAEMLAWDDPEADPGLFDICVLRSTWNYHLALDAFLAWVDHAERVTRLMNPGRVVRWNIDKRYLDELSRAGVPIVPTVWASRGSRVDLARVLDERGWGEVVIKPTVSAGSFQTRRFGVGQAGEAQSFLDALTAERDAMVQLYMPSVEAGGERALMWIDGELTHAVSKSPRFADGEEAVSEALAITPEEAAFAERVLAATKETSPSVDLLYARVDVMRDEAGGLVLSELELIEPSLFFVQHPPALVRFVKAIGRRVKFEG